MPSLGADMTEGTLLEWQVRPGDVVHRGDVVAVVDTDKAAIDVEVFEDGTIDELLVQPGTKVPVGTPLARLRTTEATEVPVAATPVAPVPVAPAATRPGPAVTSPLVRHLAHDLAVDLSTVTGTGPDGAVTRADVRAAAPPAPADTIPVRPPAAAALRASPRARRRAAERGVDLAGIIGTGPDGAVTFADVERSGPADTAVPAPQAPVPKPRAGDRADKHEAGRRAVGELMARSKREIPHYYVATTVDMSAAVGWLARTNAGRPVNERIVPAALVLKAVATAARAVPEMNGWWVDDGFAPSEHVHLAVAVSLRGGGLVAPAILDADMLALDELMDRLQDLVTRARSGRLRRRELTDATLTVTNLGDQGAEEVFGVIFAPQVALVGVGRVTERAWAQDGMVGARPTVRVSVAADHRVSDGHLASRYLARIGDLLHRPEEL
jgi:pyruvate dehydrogenase E2 component (dihydrolipoamide acetyltransferase)